MLRPMELASRLDPGELLALARAAALQPATVPGPATSPFAGLAPTGYPMPMAPHFFLPLPPSPGVAALNVLWTPLAVPWHLPPTGPYQPPLVVLAASSPADALDVGTSPTGSAPAMAALPTEALPGADTRTPSCAEPPPQDGVPAAPTGSDVEGEAKPGVAPPHPPGRISAGPMAGTTPKAAAPALPASVASAPATCPGVAVPGPTTGAAPAGSALLAPCFTPPVARPWTPARAARAIGAKPGPGWPLPLTPQPTAPLLAAEPERRPGRRPPRMGRSNLVLRGPAARRRRSGPYDKDQANAVYNRDHTPPAPRGRSSQQAVLTPRCSPPGSPSPQGTELDWSDSGPRSERSDGSGPCVRGGPCLAPRALAPAAADAYPPLPALCDVAGAPGGARRVSVSPSDSVKRVPSAARTGI